MQFWSADEAGEWLTVLGSMMDAAILLLAAAEQRSMLIGGHRSVGGTSRVNNLLRFGNDRFFEHFLQNGRTFTQRRG